MPGPRKAANIASFRRSMAGICQAAQLPVCVVTDQRPNGILNYASIDRTPQVLAALLAVLGLAVLGQFVVVSGRQRRQDFAILKTLGLLRRQLTLITSWQVTTLTLLALLVGLPLGIAAGRWSWALFATSLGIPAGAITPASLILLMVPTVILIANAVAFWPAGQPPGSSQPRCYAPNDQRPHHRLISAALKAVPVCLRPFPSQTLDHPARARGTSRITKDTAAVRRWSRDRVQSDRQRYRPARSAHGQPHTRRHHPPRQFGDPHGAGPGAESHSVTSAGQRHRASSRRYARPSASWRSSTETRRSG
jgi:hypothetical protein